MGDVVQFMPAMERRRRERRAAEMAQFDAVLPMIAAPIALTIACGAILTALWLRRWG